VNNKQAQEAGQHYDNLIWVVLAGGIASSLWILYSFHNGNNLTQFNNAIMLTMGLIFLLHSFILIISFDQKRRFYYRIANPSPKGNYIKIRYVGETILSLIVLIYGLTFYKIGLIYVFILLFLLFLSVILNYNITRHKKSNQQL